MNPKWNAAVLAIAWIWSCRGEIRVGPGDRSELPLEQGGQRLRKRGAEIGVRGAAIAGVPTRIDAELHQVGQSADLLGARRLAARQGAEFIEVHRLCAHRYQIRVQERGVALLVERVAGNVLRAVGIEVHEGRLIAVHRCERRVCLHGELARSEPPQLGILLPEIGFDQLRRCEQPQDVDVSPDSLRWPPWPGPETKRVHRRTGPRQLIRRSLESLVADLRLVGLDRQLHSWLRILPGKYELQVRCRFA